jgi:hypothetical protein
MRKNRLVLIILLSMVLMVGCGRQEQYGSQISLEEHTQIAQILEQPEEFEGKIVRIEGKIIKECPTGCWFVLKQNKTELKVELMPSGFAIPQRTGRYAIVEGKVVLEENKPVIIGKGVVIK